MSYVCQVDLETHPGKPVKVVTHQRRVEYNHDKGTSTGLETVREVDAAPENVDILGDPIIVNDPPRVVDARSAKKRAADERRASRFPTDEKDLPSYEEYQQNQQEK